MLNTQDHALTPPGNSVDNGAEDCFGFGWCSHEQVSYMQYNTRLSYFTRERLPFPSDPWSRSDSDIGGEAKAASRRFQLDMTNTFLSDQEFRFSAG